MYILSFVVSDVQRRSHTISKAGAWCAHWQVLDVVALQARVVEGHAHPHPHLASAHTLPKTSQAKYNRSVPEMNAPTTSMLCCCKPTKRGSENHVLVRV